MSTNKILDIIENLQEKLKNHRPFHMKINNINNNYRNFNNSNINNNHIEEIINKNNNINFMEHNNLNDNYIRKIIKEEFSSLILPYQQDMSGRIGVLELRMNKMNNLFELNHKNRNRNINMNMNMENNNKNIDYGNKIAEIEYKLSEFESFFKSWKEVIKKSDSSLTESLNKHNDEQELKLMKLETKINNELNKFYNIINTDINNIKKALDQIKDNEIELNKLEGEIKNIKVDCGYLNKDVKELKTLFSSGIKKDLDNINQKNIGLINDMNLLKMDFEKMNKYNSNFKGEISKMKNDIKNFGIINRNNQIKISTIIT